LQEREDVRKRCIKQEPFPSERSNLNLDSNFNSIEFGKNNRWKREDEFGE